MRIILAAALAATVICGPARAQSADDQLTAAMQSLPNITVKVIGSVCHGPDVYGWMAAPADDMAAQLKCQSLAVMVMGCNDLADQAGSFLDAVDSGQYASFDAIKENMDSHTSPPDGYEALVLAHEAPPGTTPAQLTLTTYHTCIATLGLR
jgi:hypothetical protein